MGEYKSEASTLRKVPNNTMYFLLTITPSLLGLCYSCKVALASIGQGFPQQQGQENCCTHPWQQNQFPLCTEPMGARRGHFTQTQDTAEKIITGETFCISKLIPSFLLVCLTSALALEGAIQFLHLSGNR